MPQLRILPLAVITVIACALAWSADWLTDGGNPQRTAWQQDEKILTTANVGGMKLLWKLKLDNQPRVMHSLFPPLVIERLSTPGSAPRQVAIEAGSSDNIYAIDIEKGEVIWKKHFESSFTPPANGRGAPGILCPGGQTATPVHWPAGERSGNIHHLRGLAGTACCTVWTPPMVKTSRRLPNGCRPTASRTL